MYNRQIEWILEFTSLQQRNPFNNIRLIVFGYRKFEKYKSKEFFGQPLPGLALEKDKIEKLLVRVKVSTRRKDRQIYGEMTIL